MITVIVPIYNAENYLHKCIQSICEQTYSDLQIVLVDDGSTDQSLSIAQHFATTDKRITLISQTNQGQAVARNKGLEIAKGEYVGFVDADDFIDPDFLLQAYSSIEDFDMVQMGYKRVNTEGTTVLKTDIPLNPYRLTSFCCRLFRRDFIESNHLRFPVGHIYEDALLSVDLWIAQPKIKMLNYAGYNYRVNPHSTTSQKHNTDKLYSLLKTKFNNANSVKSKLIVLYTTLRLKMHFLLNRK